MATKQKQNDRPAPDTPHIIEDAVASVVEPVMERSIADDLIATAIADPAAATVPPLRTQAAANPAVPALPALLTNDAAPAAAQIVVAAPAEPEPPAPASLGAPAGANQIAPRRPTQQKAENIMKNAEQFVAFSQGNVEAIMKSSQIWTAGMQGLSKQLAANAQLAMDETVATLKALTGVKSVKEAMELQTTLARSTVEKAVAGSSQIADASFKLAEQTMAPLTERLQLASQSFAITA